MAFVPVKIETVPTNEAKPGSPSHRTIYVSIYPTREMDYEKVMRNEDASHNPNAEKPKVNVTWNEAAAFCERMSQSDQARSFRLTYRLPKDYEWSYAVGGLGKELERPQLDQTPMGKNHGVSDVYPPGCDPNGNKPPAAGQGGIAPVGKFGPTGSGLYDMGGNVLQWCASFSNDSDTYGGHRRVVRGSSWKTFQDPDARKLLSSSRRDVEESKRQDDLGFRCVAEVGE